MYEELYPIIALIVTALAGYLTHKFTKETATAKNALSVAQVKIEQLGILVQKISDAEADDTITQAETEGIVNAALALIGK